MAAQLVGDKGQEIGIDMNDAMLTLARKYQAEMAGKQGGDRVRFLKGYIQDLALDLSAMEDYLKEHPMQTAADLAELKAWQATQRRIRPLIPDRSVDLVISNCVLNLVDDNDKQQLVHEIYRVLKPGGRIAIADIVSNEPIPAHLKTDPKLWAVAFPGHFRSRNFWKYWLRQASLP